MGVVYDAEQRGVGQFLKILAVKLIREEYSAIPEFQQNFIGEARLVADLMHTNIVQTYHLGQVEGQYYMVIEYVNGVNLEYPIERHRALQRPIPADIGVFILSRIARGLAYAHENVRTLPIPRFGSLRPTIDEGLEAILQRCLQRDRDRRYQTAAEVLDALERYLSSDGYSPTNEKLGVYLRELVDYQPPRALLASLP